MTPRIANAERERRRQWPAPQRDPVSLVRADWPADLARRERKQIDELRPSEVATVALKSPGLDGVKPSRRHPSTAEVAVGRVGRPIWRQESVDAGSAPAPSEPDNSPLLPSRLAQYGRAAQGTRNVGELALLLLCLGVLWLVWIATP